MKIGHSIKLIRNYFDLSQEELSTRTGISQTSISQIENGVKRPSQKTIDKICKVLEIPEAILYIIGIEDADVPKSRKKVYDEIFPEIKGLAIKMLGKKNGKLLM